MLPVVRGEAATRRQILVYSVALVAFTVLPYATGLFGGLYLAAALVLGGGFLALAARLWLRPSRRAAVAFTSPRSPTWHSSSARWRWTGHSRIRRRGAVVAASLPVADRGRLPRLPRLVRDPGCP